jgi:hypothetical protein
MKAFLLSLALVFSFSVHARQYIQCSTFDTTDVMVVNLETPKGGTLFLSSGMQNPEDERILVKIQFDKVEGEQHIFKIVDEAGEGAVSVPASVIGKSSNSFLVDLAFANFNFSFSCFSRIYND